MESATYVQFLNKIVHVLCYRIGIVTFYCNLLVMLHATTSKKQKKKKDFKE